MCLMVREITPERGGSLKMARTPLAVSNVLGRTSVQLLKRACHFGGQEAAAFESPIHILAIESAEFFAGAPIIEVEESYHVRSRSVQ